MRAFDNNPFSRRFLSGSILAALACIACLSAPTYAQTIFYVGNTADNTVRAVDASGATTVYATLPGAANNVQGLAFDAAGNLYVASQISNTVTMITSDGTQSAYVSTGLSAPQGIAFDSKGNLFIVNNGNGTVVKVTPGGSESTVANGIATPYGCAVDVADNVYIASYSAGAIFKLSNRGSLTTFANVSEPYGLAFDSAGNLWVMSPNAGLLTKIKPGGTATQVASGLGDSLGVFIDPSDNVFIGDYGANSILQVAANGTFSTFSTQVTNPAFLTGPFAINAEGLTLRPRTAAGGDRVVGTIKLANPVTNRTLVALSSSNPTLASVPANTTIQAGHSASAFEVTTSPVTSNHTITITATVNGGAQSAVLTLTKAKVIDLVLNGTTVAGGASSNGTVTISGPASNGGVQVALSSDNVAATVPLSVQVLDGQTTATFTVTTSQVSSTTTATIKATAGGSFRTAQLTIVPP
jgi:sugar lactone lactonase YvrE